MASTQFCKEGLPAEVVPNAFREPILNAPQPERHVGARPTLCSGDRVDTTECRLLESAAYLRCDLHDGRRIRLCSQHRSLAEGVQDGIPVALAASRLQPGDGLCTRRGAYSHPLAAAQNRRWQPGGLGRHKKQNRLWRRFLECLEQGIRGKSIQSIRRRQDANLVAALVARERKLLGKFAYSPGKEVSKDELVDVVIRPAAEGTASPSPTP